jgi:peptidoglycan lytic transglycosylase
MRRRIAQGLAIAVLVSLGVAQGPNRSESAKSEAAVERSVRHVVIPPALSGTGAFEVGTASWYGQDFEGKPTASGEPYNMFELTAAHPSLPLGTMVKVTNLRNRKAVVVRINDRGPVVDGRIIDVSYSAARVLNFQSRGVQRVRLDVVPARKTPPTMALLTEPALNR